MKLEECCGATNVRRTNVAEQRMSEGRMPLANVAEQRMSEGRMCFARMPEANVLRTNLFEECRWLKLQSNESLRGMLRECLRRFIE